MTKPITSSEAPKIDESICKLRERQLEIKLDLANLPKMLSQ